MQELTIHPPVQSSKILSIQVPLAFCASLDVVHDRSLHVQVEIRVERCRPDAARRSGTQLSLEFHFGTMRCSEAVKAKMALCSPLCPARLRCLQTASLVSEL